MKRFLGLILAISSLCSVYAGNDDVSKCSIVVTQSFHGWTHCHGNPKPRWYSSSIKVKDETMPYSSSDNYIVIQDVEIENAPQELFTYKFVPDRIVLLYTLDVANIKEKGHYVDSISIEYNKHDKIEDGRDAHCFMKKDEGYSFSLDFTIDDPIRIEEKDTKKNVTIRNNPY